ncbi:MAG TPA: hypothetical protein VE958_17335 [Bryobacteraceae bacterium]|jgi:hypothetical protein|nr:hypothetical protein [Bryobacteraceae bacterium]
MWTILLRPTAENAARVEQVLVAFSFASLELRAADFLRRGRVVQLEGRVPGILDGVPVAFLSRETLIKNKRATGRTQDAADVENLEQ